MRFIKRNLSYQHKIQPKFDLLKTFMDNDTFVTLQENISNFVSELKNQFQESYYIYNILDFSAPSNYYGKKRKLGIMILIHKAYQVNQNDFFKSNPFSERNSLLNIQKDGVIFRFFDLHKQTMYNMSK